RTGRHRRRGRDGNRRAGRGGARVPPQEESGAVRRGSPGAHREAVQHPAEHRPGTPGAAHHRRAGPCQQEGAVMSRALSVAAQKRYFALQAAIAETYGVQDVTRMFAVEPTLAQELNDKVTEKSDFLQRINVVPVSELKGQ